MEISYYEMSYEDIPKISSMEAEYFSQPWKEDSIAHYMELGNMLFIVAKDNSGHSPVIAGYLALLCTADESDLVSIAVREGYRRMGIARELLDIIYDMARDRGICHIHLEVREGNAAAIELYESEGFLYEGKRKGYYEKPREDALIYTKHI